MKSVGILVLSVFVLMACQPDPEPRTKTYYLHQANLNPVSGQVIFTEIEPGKLEVSITLKNTFEGVQHPAHLHFGSVREVGELAFRLNPVDGSTGRSVTVLDQVELSNGDTFTYDVLNELNGSVKIHVNGTFLKHMVLSFGNIGKNEDYFFDGVAVCTGH